MSMANGLLMRLKKQWSYLKMKSPYGKKNSSTGQKRWGLIKYFYTQNLFKGTIWFRSELVKTIFRIQMKGKIYYHHHIRPQISWQRSMSEPY